MPEKLGMKTECSALPRHSQVMAEQEAGHSGKVWIRWIWEDFWVPITRLPS